jgi:Bifunctional DNA primase/polymerase, N-terminal
LTTPAVPMTPATTSAPAKTLPDYALDCIRHGWFIFPCHPHSKSPATAHGFKDSSDDDAQIRTWWTQNPNFNIGIDLGRSNLVVYDFDKVAPFANQPPTFTVQTGRDPAKNNGIRGIQMYYTGSAKTHGFNRDGGAVAIGNDGKTDSVGEVRSRGAYVMAAGSIHPSGSAYTIISDVSLAPSPEQNVETFRVKKNAIGTDEQEEISGYVEAAFEESDIDCPNGRVKGTSGGIAFIWHIVCPWVAEHSERKNKEMDTSSSVIMYESGLLIYSCKHGHCENIRQWKEFKGWMMEKAGHPLSFGVGSGDSVLFGGRTGNPVNYESETSETNEHVGMTAFVFETADEVAHMRELGLKGVEQNTQSVEVLRQYERVLLFGVTAATKALRAAIGVGASLFDLPKDEAVKPETRYGRKVYPSYATAADAIRALDNEFGGREALLEYFTDLEKLEAVRVLSTKPKSMPLVEVRENAPSVVTESSFHLTADALRSTKLGDLYNDLFAPNDMPLELVLPALVTAASTLVPPLGAVGSADIKGSLIIPGDDVMTNLYTALIGDVHCGKSQVIEWCCKALGIYQPEKSPWYLEKNFGSTELFLGYLKKNLSSLQPNFLVNPDEWSFLFTKAGISNSSFTAFMTTTYYRRRYSQTVGGKVGEVNLNNAISYAGGIVAKDFDSVFGAGTLGGVYDRFLFGHRAGWRWSYRPFPREIHIGIADQWTGKKVTRDGSVFEVIAAWNKDPELGRIIEMCARIATIYASIDGRPIVNGQDLENLSGLAANQLAIRRQFNPNAGETPDAIFANAVINWLRANGNGGWVNISSVKKGVHVYEMKLGPNVAERAIQSLVHGGRLDLWVPKGNNPLPEGYHGGRPRLGLIRLSPVS